MTYEDAIKLLNPATTADAIEEIEYYGGLRGKDGVLKAIDEACLLACEALEKQIPRKPLNRERYESVWLGDCPSCHMGLNAENDTYCYECGQRIDWSVDDD